MLSPSYSVPWVHFKGSGTGPLVAESHGHTITIHIVGFFCQFSAKNMHLGEWIQTFDQMSSLTMAIKIVVKSVWSHGCLDLWLSQLASKILVLSQEVYVYCWKSTAVFWTMPLSAINVRKGSQYDISRGGGYKVKKMQLCPITVQADDPW